MKKLYALLALLLAFTLLLGACAKPAQDDASDAPGDDVQQTQPDDTLEQPDAPDAPKEDAPQTAVFTAAVLEAGEKTLLVEPAEGSAELASADRISVGLTAGAAVLDVDGEPCTLADIRVGDTVEITYSGMIEESYPAQITAQRIAVTAGAGPEPLLLTPVEGEWVDAASITVERVTVEQSDDAFILRALGDLEKVELARVYFDAEKQDYVQKDLLWMTDLWDAGSELAVVEKTPLDGPNLAISWQDEYGERERRLVLPLKVKTGDTLTRSVMITSYLPPFTPVELSAQVDSEGNGTAAVETGQYRGVDAFGFAPTKTEIVCRMNYDLDGCGRKESVQLLRLWDEYDQYSFALRVVKNGVNYDSGVVTGDLGGGGTEYHVQLPHYCPQLWLADLNGDNLVEIYFGGDMASDDYAFSVWTVGRSGLELVAVDGQPYIPARVVSFEDRTVKLEQTIYVLGTYRGTSRYCFGPTDTLEQLDAYWQVESTFALRLVKALPVVMSDNTQTSLPAGTQLYVTATDASSVVFFKTDAGLTGSFAIDQAEDGYSWLIAGESESAYFEVLPYAG